MRIDGSQRPGGAHAGLRTLGLESLNLRHVEGTEALCQGEVEHGEQVVKSPGSLLVIL